ncbi:MAG TPA: hypothetical protein P5026_13300 [Kiritimatiellia bacterium]|nr:hypothetical protein [Kiritimatiellia bacterium]
MKRLGKWVCVASVLCLAIMARAQQFDVKLTLAYSVFVVGEPVVVQIDLLNATRDPIVVGGAGATSVLLVEMTKGGEISELPPFRQDPVVAPFTLKPGEAAQHRISLDKWFSLEQEGKYLARVVLVHRGMRYESVKKSFDVVPGMPLGGGVQMFVNRDQLKRQFKLVFWHRNQEDRLFLRIEDDPGGRIWDSIDLGTLMRSTPPKLDISPEGEVTVIHRATQDAFLRTVLWSLPEAVEIVERNQLVDPEISASQRVNALYGEGANERKEEKKPWWKFW